MRKNVCNRRNAGRPYHAVEPCGGKTIAENCQMLCADCNRRKSNV